ncbi:universal stress protein [Mariniflexile aquimaris]|uniref:Universal stress protein n=1 Tax=Mariniflexile aquimaris TaxID=881009 RepID=A0ABW3BVW2_9FLAO
MKTILLPTDFSKNSINAINYALELYRNEACKFYVLNVQRASTYISDDLMGVSTSATIYNTIIDAAKKSVTNIISKIKKQYHNEKHEFEAIVDYDNFIDSINQVTAKYDIDMIVMGTKGATGLAKVVFGSNTARVMQRCKTPVLAIPDGYTLSGLKKIAFTTNHITTFNIKQLSVLKEMTALHHSKLHILHIADKFQEAQKQLQNMNFFNIYFEEAEHDYIDVKNKDMFKKVHRYLKDNNVEMFVMISERHSFIERLFTRHALEKFAFSIDVPFLVIHIDN